MTTTELLLYSSIQIEGTATISKNNIEIWKFLQCQQELPPGRGTYYSHLLYNRTSYLGLLSHNHVRKISSTISPEEERNKYLNNKTEDDHVVLFSKKNFRQKNLGLEEKLKFHYFKVVCLPYCVDRRQIVNF